MKIISKKEAIHVDKPEGVSLDYYMRPEYEVNYNIQKPKTSQKWHHHEKMFESLFIIEGKLRLDWKENEKIKSREVIAGDLIEVENTPHTFVNVTDQEAKFICIKQVLSGKNKQDIFKNDKILDE